MIRAIALVLAALYCAIAGAADASTIVSVRLGEEQVQIPSPPGQVPLRNLGTPAYRASVAANARVNNIVLASFRTPEDAAILDAGGSRMLKEWAVACVTSVDLDRPWSLSDFQRLRDVTARQLGKVVAGANDVDEANVATKEAIASLLKELNREPGSAAVTVGKMHPLAVYANTEKTITYGALSSIKVDVAGQVIERPVVMVDSYVNIKNHMVAVGVYRIVSDAEDIELARDKALTWVKSIISENSEER